MSEWVNDSWVYDASPEDAFRMLTRLDHLTGQAEHLGYERFAVRELRERDGFFWVTAERLMHRRGPMVHYTQRWNAPEWDGARRCEVSARFGGTSLTVSGQGLLRPAEQGGSRYSMRLMVHSDARFSARRVEREAALELITVLTREHEFRSLWLAGRNVAFPNCA